MLKRAVISVSGIVQGVGFRPFVYNLAVEMGLYGWVKNNAQGVVIEIEGEEISLEKFIISLRSEGPPLARIENIDIAYIPRLGEKTFRILASSGGEISALVSPDMGICEDCLQEMSSRRNRRYRYPFINCTNCGPRFTIIEQIPYDRKFTTMKSFTMCPECSSEYHDPTDRRFHAQPNACPECGPEIVFKDRQGKILSRGDYVWDRVKKELQQGRILAVKGLGGFNLCCDALNAEAVRTLRSRKIRWDKPFAVMMPDLAVIKSFCLVHDAEETLLTSQQRPIVLLEKQKGVYFPEEVAPHNQQLGVMLPYTPLHYLLMEGFQALIMTSGNISEEPIVFRDEDVLARLNKIADFFLTHDRKIFRACDDSVFAVNRGKVFPIRRSRGYAPEPIKAHLPLAGILACGGEQKNTFCLTKADKAFLSHHIGDLKNLPALVNYTESIKHYEALFAIELEAVAYDLHPDYISSQYAMEYPGKVIRIGIQHHHAHIASCLADNRQDGTVIGVSFDGTGYGTDGCLWGGEFLVCNYRSFKRVAHLAYVQMPSGETAVKEPWRMAASYLYAVYGREMEQLDLDFVAQLPPTWDLMRTALDKKINAPLTSSCGRLFDGIAALIGLRAKATYEGQAAVELEQVITPEETGSYPFIINKSLKENIENENLNISCQCTWEIDWKPLIRAVVDDLIHGTLAGRIAAKFHNTVAKTVLETCLLIRENYNIGRVALSGGVFQNRYLLNKTKEVLNGHNFEVLIHNRVPSNDGGLSLGQALIANSQLSAAKKENA
ncbi:MAG TPA: carbamoyltransferase HypF [Syntrophomonadaceae bacterium]|nr:carbamoyltransferase HypF [Syntrophomonadaceae bacterium]